MCLRGGGGGAKEPILCRIKKGGMHFETMCVAGMVEKFREGKATKDEVLVANEIYKDCKTGDRPSAAELEAAFGKADLDACMDELLEKGEFQLTAAERKHKTDEKTAQILTFIHQNFLDPGTGLPHPVTRIENALKTVKGLKVEPFRSAESQAQELVKKIKDVLPMVKSEMEGTVSVPLKLLGAVGGLLHKLCTVRKESATDENGLFWVTFLPGEHDHILTELSRATKGQFELKLAGASHETGGGGARAGGRSASPRGAGRSGSPRGAGRGGKGKGKAASE